METYKSDARPDKRKNSDFAGWIIFVAAIVVGLGLYPSGSVVLDGAGNPDGLLAQLRESMQGKRFWKGQVDQIDAQIAATRSMMATLFEGEQQRNAPLPADLTKLINDTRDQVLREHPQLEPSDAQQQATALRQAADQIDQANGLNVVLTLNLNRLAELSRIRAIATERSTSETNGKK